MSDNAAKASQKSPVKDLFRLAFEKTPLACAIVRSDDLDVQEANTRFLEIVCRAKAEVIGQPVATLGDRSAKSLGTILAAAIPTKAAQEFEWSKKDHAGETRHYTVSLDTLGTGECSLVTIRDVSEDREMERQLASTTEAERARLRVELHDGLCQELAAVSFMLEVVRRKLSKFPEAHALLHKSTEKISEIVNKSILETHALAGSLFPDGLIEAGLAAMLEQLSADLAKLHKIRGFFRTKSRPLLLDSETSIHVYRIIQECLRNAIISRGATECSILLESEGDRCIVSMIDNGSQLTDPGRSRLLTHRIRLLEASFEESDMTGKKVQSQLSFNFARVNRED